MRSKKFRFRKRTLQMRVNGTLCLALLVLSLVLFLVAETAWPLQVMAVVSLIALIMGNRADKRMNGYFYVDNDELIIKNAVTRRRLRLEQVKDISIVDAGAARRYLLSRIELSDNTLSSAKRIMLFTQFSTVELGINNPLNWLYKLIQNNMNTKTTDLVLIRLGDGTDLLLTPHHAHDAVSYLNKVLSHFLKESALGLFNPKHLSNA